MRNEDLKARQIRKRGASFDINASSGFTLMELLVVIGIIGILAGLLTAGITRAKERGTNAFCFNNLRQLGVSVRLYADDSNGRFPHIINPHLDAGSAPKILHSAIRQLLTNFTQSSKVFNCRADRSGNFKRGGSSYEWNPVWNGKLIDKHHITEAQMMDFAPRHGGIGGRNGVFADGHVEELK